MGTDDEGLLKRMADTLGVLPDLTPPLAARHYNVKLVICVEGPNDVAFLKAISQIAHRAYPDIIDLNMSPLTVVIPLGGRAPHRCEYNFPFRAFLFLLRLSHHHVY